MSVVSNGYYDNHQAQQVPKESEWRLRHSTTVLFFCFLFWVVFYALMRFDVHGLMSVRSGVLKKAFSRLNFSLNSFAPQNAKQQPSTLSDLLSLMARSVVLEHTAVDIPFPHYWDPSTSAVVDRRDEKKHATNIKNDFEVAGTSSLSLMVFRPAVTISSPVEDILPVIIYVHGGGWVAGSADSYKRVAQKYADSLNVLVVVIDYSLAPENPYPSALNEVIEAYLWVGENAGAYGGDPSKVGFMGDSAGGNLIVCSVLKMMHTNEAETDPSQIIPRPMFQIVMYPVLDISRFNRPSHDRYALGYLITRRSVRQASVLYLDATHDDPATLQAKREDPYVSPLMADRFTGMPPTLIINGKHDVLESEGAEFHHRLVADGVQCKRVVEKEMMHGFMSNVFPGALKRVTETVIKPWIREFLL